MLGAVLFAALGASGCLPAVDVSAVGNQAETGTLGSPSSGQGAAGTSGSVGTGAGTSGGSAGSGIGGADTAGGSTSGGKETTGGFPCQFVVAPSQINIAQAVPVGSNSPVLTFEIQNVGVSICLFKGIENVTAPWFVVSTSIAPDMTGSVAVPPPGPGAASSLTIGVELECVTAGTFSTPFLDGMLSGTCG